MTAKELTLSQLRFARECVNKFSQGFSTEQALVPIVNNGNHLFWLLGHIAFGRSVAIGLCTGQTPQDDPFAELFANKTKPKPDASTYPPLDEVLAEVNRRHEALEDFVRSLDDKELQKPLTQELPGAPFVKTRLDAVNLLLSDELMHAGQIIVLRKAVGLPSPFAD